MNLWNAFLVISNLNQDASLYSIESWRFCCFRRSWLIRRDNCSATDSKPFFDLMLRQLLWDFMSPSSNLLSYRMRCVSSEALTTSYFRLPSRQINDLSLDKENHSYSIKNWVNLLYLNLSNLHRRNIIRMISLLKALIKLLNSNLDH